MHSRQSRQQHRHISRPRAHAPTGSDNDKDEYKSSRRVNLGRNSADSATPHPHSRLRPASPASAPSPYTPERELDDGESSSPSPATGDDSEFIFKGEDNDSKIGSTDTVSHVKSDTAGSAGRLEGVREGFVRRVKEVAAVVRKADKCDETNASKSHAQQQGESSDSSTGFVQESSHSLSPGRQPSPASAWMKRDMSNSAQAVVHESNEDNNGRDGWERQSSSDTLQRIDRPDRLDKSEPSDFSERLERMDRYEPRSFSSTEASSSSSSLTSGSFRAPEIRMPDRERPVSSNASSVASSVAVGGGGLDLTPGTHFSDTMTGRSLRAGDRRLIPFGSGRHDSAGSHGPGTGEADPHSSATPDQMGRQGQGHSRLTTGSLSSSVSSTQSVGGASSFDGQGSDDVDLGKQFLSIEDPNIGNMESSNIGTSQFPSFTDSLRESKSKTSALTDSASSIMDDVHSRGSDLVTPFDDTSEDGEYYDLPGSDLDLYSDFNDSRGRSLSGNLGNRTQLNAHIPPWSLFHRMQRNLEAIETSLLTNSTTPELAEKEMLRTARFVLANRSMEVAYDRRAALAKSNTLKALMTVMQKFRKNARVATVGCSVISALATGDSTVQKALGATGAIQIIVECIESNLSGDEQMTESGLRSLSTLTWIPENRDIMRLQRGVDVIIAAMGKHAYSQAIQTEGATLLANCAFGSEENKRAIVDSFGIDLIITAMKQFPDNTELQSRACLALRNLTYGMPVIVDSAGAKGGIAAVMCAMDMHGEDANVVEQGAVALFNMLSGNLSNIERLFGNPVYLEILLGALKRFPDSEVIQCNILSVIQSVAREKQVAITHLAQADGLHVVVSSMRAGITKPSILHEGAACLHAIMSAREGRSDMGKCLDEAGGIEALFELLYIAVTAPQGSAS